MNFLKQESPNGSKRNHKHRRWTPCLKHNCNHLRELYPIMSVVSVVFPFELFKASKYSHDHTLYSGIEKVCHMSGQTLHEMASGAFYNFSQFPPFHPLSAANQG